VATTPRSARQIESDLTATRSRLTSSIETLIDRVHPTKVKQRQVARLKELLAEQVARAKGQIYDERGQLRSDRLLVAGTAVASVLAVTLVGRRIAARGRR
jgi:hypothetical protein